MPRIGDTAVTAGCGHPAGPTPALLCQHCTRHLVHAFTRAMDKAAAQYRVLERRHGVLRPDWRRIHTTYSRRLRARRKRARRG